MRETFDLGIRRYFTDKEWSGMSPYMQNYWLKGGRSIRWHFIWFHESEQAIEISIENAWLKFANNT